MVERPWVQSLVQKKKERKEKTTSPHVEQHALEVLILPLGTFGNTGDMFGCHDGVCGGAPGMEWVETKDAAQASAVPGRPRHREWSGLCGSSAW